MHVRLMNFMKRPLALAAVLLVAGASLSGCVVYPSGYGYGYGPSYYAAPVYGGVFVGGGYRGGYGRRW
jgi:hypothetical protein